MRHKSRFPFFSHLLVTILYVCPHIVWFKDLSVYFFCFLPTFDRAFSLLFCFHPIFDRELSFIVFASFRPLIGIFFFFCL